MVANFGGFKRHKVLFKAIKKLDVSVFCVGVPLGSRDKRSIEKEASEEGVSDKVTVIENPSQEELREYFVRAKSFAALSKREGSFIAVSEALVSGSPVMMFKNAQIGTKRLISENNGRLLKNQSELVDAIRHFGDHNTNHQRIRDDAIGLCDARQSSKRLNEDIRAICTLKGENWSQSLTPIYCVRFKFYHFGDKNEVDHRSDYSRLESLGVTFEM